MERQAKEYVEVIRTVAPKYDKHLHSKIQRPGLYGIRLTPAAEAAIVVAFGEPYNRARVDKHKGSPPRVRGTVDTLLATRNRERITPACAGNRNRWTIQAMRT